MKTGKKFLASTLLATATLTFCTTSANADDLIWNGTSGNNSWTTDEGTENWLSIWQVKKAWSDGDNATFDSTAAWKSVSIKEAITAGTITVSSGDYTFAFANNGSVTTSSLIVSEGASLTLGDSTALTVGDETDDDTDAETTICGTLKISGGTITFEDGVYVGNDSGTGTLDISGGETTFSSEVFITGGTFKISDGTTIFLSSVYVGDNGTGILDISGGTITFEDGVYVGNDGGTGTLNISGGAITFGKVYVGYSYDTGTGNGTLTISGGTTFSDIVYVGYSYGEGTATGKLEISNAETTFSKSVYIGYAWRDAAFGTVEITGGETTFNRSVTIGFGYYLSSVGTGTLKISNALTIFESAVYIGNNSGVITSGQNNAGDGNGTLEISGGKTTFSDWVYVARVTASGTGTGTITISNNETIFEYVVVIGEASSDATANGLITISGGTTTFGGELRIGYYQGVGKLEIFDSETIFKGTVYDGEQGTGTITISGGTTTFSDTVYVGYSSFSGSNGTLEISGGKTTFSGIVYVGYCSSSSTTGAFKISDNETIFEDTVYVGRSRSSNAATGTLEISGGKTTFSSSVDVGYCSSSYRATGTVKISDGETIFKGTVYVGRSSSSGTATGTLEISGGTTTFYSSVYVGRSSSSGTATGTLKISGGTVSVTDSLTSTGSISVSGGSLELSGTVDISSAISNSGTVIVSDSTVFVLDNLTSDGDTYTIISGGTIEGWDSLTKSNFKLNGSAIGERSVVDISVDGKVTITVNVTDLTWNGTETGNIWTTGGEENWLDDGNKDVFSSGDSATFDDTAESKTVIVEGSINASSITVKSGYYTFTGDGSITTGGLVVDSGASLTLAGSGELTTDSATIGGTLEITNGETTITTVEVSSEGTLTISGGTTTADSIEVAGSIELTGGELSVTGTLTSTGSISVSGNASLELSGTVDISSAISNSGTVIVSDSTVFVLDNLTSDGDTYTIISGGTIEGWDSLTKSNFQLNGSGLGRATVEVSVDGQVTIIEGGIGDLVWDGTASDNVWTNSGEEIWLNNEEHDVFVENDNVTFGADGTKSVSVVGAIEAGTVTVTGNGYTFTFSEDSSVTADSLTIDSGASLTLAGSGELTTSSATVSGKLEITSGEATITSVEVSSEGTLKISGGATTADSIDVAGSIELTGGELTVKTLYLHHGSGSFSGGILNVGGITTNINDLIGKGSLSFGDGLTVNLYDTTSLTIDAEITLSGTVTFNAEDDETITLSGTLDGSGKLVKDGNGTLTVSGTNEYTGGTTISSGTIVAQSENALGTGAVAIDDGATLEIPTSREFTNATSGNGTLSITNDATVSFGSNVGVKNVNVASGATLSGSTTLTHSNAQLVLAGTLVLDASAGEKISFSNGGTVILEDSATLTLSGISAVSPTSVKPLDAGTEEIGPGSSITIFSGATIEGDIEAFLATDSTLLGLSSNYAVVYDPDKGLSVTVLESGNASSLTSGLKLHDGIGSDFISAVIRDEDLEFDTGLIDADELNPIVRALVTGNISEAAKMMDTLAPSDYAAMVAMPTTSFYNDVKAIDNRLAARRGPIDENARWEFFAQAQGTFIENDDASDTQTFDFDLYGVLAGADYRVNEGLTVGVTVGYDYGKADIHNSGGKIESDDVRITVFAGQQIGEMFFVNAGAQVGYGHYEAKRKTAYGNANGDTDGWNAGVFADVGMMLTLSEELKIAARPYVGLAYLHSEVGSFDDNLFDVDDFHGDSLRASIGCGVFWGFDLAETAWSVGLDASYSHDFCGDEVDIDATYMSTGKDFGITAKALSKDIFSVGPTVSVGITKSIDIFAGYAFQASTDSSIGQNVYLGVRASF